MTTDELKGIVTSGGYFDTRLSYAPGRNQVWRVICRYLERVVPADATVVDLGAGYCSFINNVRAARKHAVDIFPGFAEHAAPDVQIHVGRCWELESFQDGSVDVVFASNLLEHLSHEEIAATLEEARRILRCGGRLILIQPNFRYCPREYFDDYTHQTVFTHVSLTDFVTAVGFRVDTVVARFMPLTLKSRLPQWPWLVALYFKSPVRPFAKQMLLIARREERI